MRFIPDTYTRKARLQPALIVGLPVALTVFILFPDEMKAMSLLWSLVSLGGGTALISQIARDPGKRKEPVIYKNWGGQANDAASEASKCC